MIIDIDPKVDIVFKRLFGSPDHPNITLNFVNAILEAAGLPPAISLSIQNPFTLGAFPEDRLSVLDMLYREERGKEIQLEMQMQAHAGLAQRMVHVWSQLYTQQLGKGQDHTEHRPVISIWILNDSLWADGRWFHLFRFQCPLTGLLLHDDACIITIELPVWLRLIQAGDGAIVNNVERWNYFFTQAKGQDSEELYSTLGDPVFKEAVEFMTEFKFIRQLRHAYEIRQENLRLISAYKRTGFEEGKATGLVDGLAEGLAKGLAKGKAEGKVEGFRETARKMKAKHLPLKEIAEMTGLTVQEIESL